jgi:hypothetical protein
LAFNQSKIASFISQHHEDAPVQEFNVPARGIATFGFKFGAKDDADVGDYYAVGLLKPSAAQSEDLPSSRRISPQDILKLGLIMRL